MILLKEHAREVHELPASLQQALFSELMAAARAVQDAFSPWKLNYSCFGNADPHVHWHIHPRYESDPDHRNHPWLHSADFSAHRGSDAERSRVIAQIRAALAYQR